MKLLLLLFLASLCYVTPFEFEDAKEVGVEFGEKTPTAQIVTADEDNAVGTYKVVKITGVQGEITLNILSTNSEKFAPKVVIEEEIVYITTLKVDYEALISEGLDTRLLIEVGDSGGGSTTQNFMVSVKNLDDESPTLTTTNCLMNEEEEVTIDTSQCVFTVTDRDGWLSTMDFSGIKGGPKGEEDIFELQYKVIPSDTTYSSDVYLVLKSEKTLDYETTTLYTFTIVAKDATGHETPSVPIIVQVQDMPDQPPVWDSSFKSALTIREELEDGYTIPVSAKDGDVGIANTITYKIEGGDDFVSIDDTGLITVKRIDRDQGYDQLQFMVIAIEVEEPTSTTNGSITLIVEDIDDNIPKITVVGLTEITIDEGSSDITDLEIFATDIDLGENAIYTAELISTNEEVLNAFKIIPGRGYENTSLGLTIMNPSMLDFENDAFRNIEMELKTAGTKNTAMTDSVTIKIALNDLNDEIPVFDPTEYTAEIKENVGAGTFLAIIRATDRDAADADLKHTLSGTLANNILEIEALGGNVTTKIDNAFDYEKQQEVVVQIIAEDNAKQRSTAQLTITVLDVNDEKPKLAVSSAFDIEENQDPDSIIDTNISASDEDSNADLEFSINWTGSYASKNSQRATNEVFETIQCINIKTLPGTTNNQVVAELSIKETQPGNTPDFEVFDSLYLQLVVTDKNTDPSMPEATKTDTATIVINIIDRNDNAPVFAEGTETLRRQVTENSASGIVISSVVAKDDDLGTILEYSIASADSSPNWVAIASDGTISVSLEDGDVIDCDYPDVKWSLNYTVTVTDGDFNASADINIIINDVNDNSPKLDNQRQEIKEDNELDPDHTQNGLEILALLPSDNDRNEEFRTVQCKFSTSTGSDITDRFQIDDDNTIFVALSNGATLDRETSPEYTVTLNCYDDPTQQGPLSNTVTPEPKITIVLTDVNDKKPKISEATSTIVGLTENTQKDSFSAALVGEDGDDGENGYIKYVSITKITRSEGEVPPQDLFVVEDAGDNKNGILKLNPANELSNLEGYYGSLVVTVKLTDAGEEPLSEDVDVTIQVEKFNFKAPKFEFPKEQVSKYYLTSNQAVNSGLKLWNDDPLSNLKATDQQNDKYVITFTVDDGGANLFKIVNYDNSEGQLQLSSSVSSSNNQRYDLTVTAKIPGSSISPEEESYSSTCNITIEFFDWNATDPIFETLVGSVEFEENKKDQTFQVPPASYPDVDIIDLDVYYLLWEGDETIFDLDIQSGVVTLLEELDYDDGEVTSYELVIQSSNSDSMKQKPAAEARFTLTVNIKDLNDNPPVFTKDEFVTILTITTGSDASTLVATITATDKDTTSANALRYTLDKTEGSNEELTKIALAEPFTLDDVSGEIMWKFSASNSALEGYFTLSVTVADEDDLKDTAQVKIYLVTNKHMVNFRFDNDRETVETKRDGIKAVLDKQFPKYVSTVGQAATDTADEGIKQTKVPIFFVDTASNVPIEATEVLTQVTNVNFFREVQKAFSNETQLVLLSFVSDTEATVNLEDTLKAWLIGVAVVLGSLCLILLAAFILKTRALNQRIDKLSNTKFGSQESGLNRTGVTAPTTNRHAVEGSNPVYNNDDTKDIDRRSVTSGDSDLIGVEDDENFNYEPTNDDHSIRDDASEDQFR